MVRISNSIKFRKSIELRKKGFSYSEIRREVIVAKSTLQGWLEKAGLLNTKEHIEIQLKKRIENRLVATEASRLTRERKTQAQIQSFLEKYKKEVSNPLFIGGCLLYEAEGQKKGVCIFSNSDYRMVIYFIKFIERYFDRDRIDGMIFRLYIHENRKADLLRILRFWSEKLLLPQDKILVSWKKHKVKRRTNNDYFGQIAVKVKRSTIITKKIRAISDIILI